MRAFVLGAGGNLGAMQVGALYALLERNIYPDLIVGCSVGGLNAAFLAQDLSPAGVERLKQIWLNVRLRDIYPDSALGKMWRLLTGKDSLFTNQNFYKFLVSSGIAPDYTFDHVQQTKLLITAANLQSGKLHTFGDGAQEKVLDALMATTALPPFHAPWEIEGQRYIDGGAVTCLPIRVAIEKGATEIYVLRVEENKHARESRTSRGVVNVVRNSVHNMIHAHMDFDLHLARHTPSVRTYYIQLTAPKVQNKSCFKVIPDMIDKGYEITEAKFRNGQPLAERTETVSVEGWPRLPYYSALQSA